MASKQSFLVLCLIAFLDWMSYGLVFPLFAILLFHQDPIFLAETFDVLRGFLLGLLLSASPLAQLFSSSFIGTLSDQIGRKRTLQITLLVITAGYLFSAIGIWSASLLLLIIGRVVTGIGAGNIAVINSSVADLSEPKTKTRNFAFITMANGIGFSVGPFLGGKLSKLGYATPFIFAGVLTLITLIFLNLLFTETHPKEKNGRSLIAKLHHMIKTASLSKFRIFFLIFLIFCFGWSFYWEFIPVTWIKIHSLNVSQIGDFYAYASAFYVLSSGLLIQPIVKRYKPLPILLFSLAALGICLLPPLFGKVGLYWIFIPLQQFLIALIFPIGTAMVSNAVTKNRQGEILGAFQALQSFAFAITPFLGGVLLHLNYSITLIVGSLAMFLAFLILLVSNLKKEVLT